MNQERFPSSHHEMNDSVEQPKAEKKEHAPRSRRGIVRRSLHRLMTAGLALMAFFSESEAKHPGEAQAVERVENIGENDKQSEMAGPEKMIQWEGREYRADEFDAALLVQFQEILGSLADRCDDAEQCYYYYADQLSLDVKAISTLTGKSEEELVWIGRVMRGGFVRQPGIAFPGTLVGVVEVGRRDLPPVSKGEKHQFYRLLYEFHRTGIADAYAEFRVAERDADEQLVLAEQVAKSVEASTRLANMEMQVRYGQRQYQNFFEWFTRGVGDGLPSGEDKWEAAFAAYQTSIQNMYDCARRHPLAEDPGDALFSGEAYALARAAEEYHGDRLEVFTDARDAAENRWFTGDEAKSWAQMEAMERERLSELEQKVGAVKKEESALVATAKNL